MRNYFSFAIILLTIFCRNVYALDYSIVVNCGSTGTRLHFYSIDKSDPEHLPIIKEITPAKTTAPGLASFAGSPASAAQSLKPLFDEAATLVDPHLVSVQILGTAGMRELKKTEQQAIYEAINTVLTHYAFKSIYTHTISGKWEGIYSWLDVNYLLHNFENKTLTQGTVDIGGASTQITFEVAKPLKQDTSDLTINDITYHIFTKSFLGLGQNEAQNSIALKPEASRCYPEQFDLLICQSLYNDLINQHRVREQLAGVINKISQQSFIAHFSSPANTVYVDYLLLEVYHLNSENLTITNTIDGKNIDWTLGVVLYDSIF